MALNTGISWADHTFNPWVGCQKVSPACDNCYAERLVQRFGGEWGPGSARRRTRPANWNIVRRIQKNAAAFFAEHGRKPVVFVASLADVFDNAVPRDWRADLWLLTQTCPDVLFLLLTKRSQNIAGMLPRDWGQGYANVWLGVTAENQTEAERRLPILLFDIPAAGRFVSCEPLLGPIDLYGGDPDPRLGGHKAGMTLLGEWWQPGDRANGRPRRGPDFVIAGGESGPSARATPADWFRSLRDQCSAAGVPFHFKQWGEFNANGDRVGVKRAGRLLDGGEHIPMPDPEAI